MVESRDTRDHTERMLAAMGVPVETQGNGISAHPTARSSRWTYAYRAIFRRRPSCWRAADRARFACASAGRGVNPGRVGILRVLGEDGRRLHLHNERAEDGEPVADIELRHGPMSGTTIERRRGARR